MNPHPYSETTMAAGALFRAAANKPALSAVSRLHCLAAADHLGSHTTAHQPPADADPAGLIHSALRLLGNLPVDDFGQPAVLDAAENGRRALLNLH